MCMTEATQGLGYATVEITIRIYNIVALSLHQKILIQNSFSK